MADRQQPTAETRVLLVPRSCLLLIFAISLAPTWCRAQPMAGGYHVAARAESSPQPIDECQIIAKVDGQVILSCELLWQVNLRMEQVGDQIPPEHRRKVREQMMQQFLMEVLDLRMIYADFLRSTDGMADMESIRKDLAGPFEESEVPRLMKVVGVKDRKELAPRLLELGTSLRERREDFNRSTIARQWMQQSLDFDKTVTPQQMLDYYHAHSEEYDYPTQAKWEELMVACDQFASDREAAQAYHTLAIMGNQVFEDARRAQAIQPVFAEVAKAKSQGFTASDGGQHDWTTKGALADEKLDQALFLLPPGQMSDILRSRRGFHIVRVLDRKQAGRTPFTEVQPEIREAIQDERFSAAITKKLKHLKGKAHIWTVFTGDLKSQAEMAEAGESKTR